MGSLHQIIINLSNNDKIKPLADHHRDGGDCNLRSNPEHGRVLVLSCADRGDCVGRNQTNLR